MLQRSITRRVKQTHVKAEYVNPETKQFYNAEVYFNGVFLTDEKAEQEIRKVPKPDELLVFLRVTLVEHEEKIYTMPLDVFVAYATEIDEQGNVIEPIENEEVKEEGDIE